ncbi:MAG TPA: NAD-dependent epimerase/dehydratase family protein [Sphingomicrobium sp.]|nr:NAD-dependent epimerase/dehydratase family protein [Sphingomicrobium sp.]
MTIAVTGGTGFVGTRFIDIATAAGHEVRALTRRPQRPQRQVEWVDGALEDAEALRKLVTGCDSVVHIAGVLKASDAKDFDRGNVEGTLAMLAASTAAGISRFVHVSSLAAREPQLSLYGASKARSEELVERSGLDWVIVRPPAVYGPGDKETLDLFKMARRGQIFMPPRGRLSLIHVGDLARLLLACADESAPSKLVIEPDDGRAGGWSHREFGDALGRAVGTPARTVSTPRFLLSFASRADRLVRGANAKLTADRVAYFCHPDWVVTAGKCPPGDLWKPQVETGRGLAETAAWYEREGWL